MNIEIFIFVLVVLFFGAFYWLDNHWKKKFQESKDNRDRELIKWKEEFLKVEAFKGFDLPGMERGREDLAKMKNSDIEPVIAYATADYDIQLKAYTFNISEPLLIRTSADDLKNMIKSLFLDSKRKIGESLACTLQRIPEYDSFSRKWGFVVKTLVAEHRDKDVYAKNEKDILETLRIPYIKL